MNQDKLWDAFQNDAQLVTSFRAAPRFESLLSRVAPGQRLLNIGVGDGSFEAMALARGLDVSSLDPSARSIETLRSTKSMGTKAQVGYADAIPFADGSFDVVVMSEVIEHLEDATLDASLRDVLRVLAPGGRLLGTVPADENLLEGQIVCPHCGERSHRWGHVQSFSRQRLHDTLGRRFTNVRISRHYFSDVKYLNWKGKASWAAKQLLVRLGVEGRGETFQFEATRS